MLAKIKPILIIAAVCLAVIFLVNKLDPLKKLVGGSTTTPEA